MTTSDAGAPVQYDLGTLEQMPVRDVWSWEARDFTPWLADNLSLLGKGLGLELEFEGKEKKVGPFRADILCRDVGSGQWVLIENQFGKTDHSHLGQLLTYAAGLEAVTIIWVAEQFTEEHRAALDWLNRISEEGINFFGVELELWRIGNSKPAPKFNVISRPNDWAKRVIAVTQEELSEVAQLQGKFWQQFHAYASQTSKIIKPQKPEARHWMDFSVGRSSFWLGGRINSLKRVMSVGLYIDHTYAKPMFWDLHEQKTQIETEFGATLNWVENPNKKQSRIDIVLDPADLNQREDWEAQQRWMLDMLERFHHTFAQRVKQLPAEYPEEEL